MNILAADQVDYIYQSKYQKVHALKSVSCSFEEGKFYAIVGHSGSGKTTLLSMLAGLGVPTQGQVLAGPEGKSLREIGSEKHRREDVSVIYQSFNLFPTLSILENVTYPMRINGRAPGAAKERARELLEAVGLGEVDGRKLPAMLSGGQQQRVAIARALASEAKVILADEPTGNLDSENGQMVIDLLKKLVEEKGYCVIVVTHDLGIAQQADVVYRMKDGEISLEKAAD
ncbi:ABC transporter ATP-binding protein [Oscillospiraceae bacterium 42-9]|uniref:ABC transporter ATP-binding protein n=1 Tax=Acutalibacter sp. TaxID=1918636 RepID=UPI0021715E8D|nr:ABC transporter ATP-binding protein [Acutalibacter sp.]